MESMFCKCSSLISLDLSNFKTQLVTSMRSMISNCTSLVSIDISNFNTSLVTSMDNMFSYDESLISLDLSSFNISSVQVMRNIFIGCKSLVYINLNSFMEKEHISLDNVFSKESNNLIYCIDENQSPNIINAIKSISTNNDCKNICFTKSRKIIIEKKECIDECISYILYKIIIRFWFI